ncbi:MAG: type II toxin-antitoxin system PemK/MazF family toxin [bacterium]
MEQKPAAEARPTEYAKDFDGWIEKKKDCHHRLAKPPLFKERDIWWVSVGVNIGYEEDGKHDKYLRPVLVLRKFNRELFLGVPMSTKIKDNQYYVEVTIKGQTVSTLISQLRVFSAKRIEDKLAELDTGDFQKVKDKVVQMISFSLLPKQKSRG